MKKQDHNPFPLIIDFNGRSPIDLVNDDHNLVFALLLQIQETPWSMSRVILYHLTGRNQPILLEGHSFILLFTNKGFLWIYIINPSIVTTSCIDYNLAHLNQRLTRASQLWLHWSRLQPWVVKASAETRFARRWSETLRSRSDVHSLFFCVYFWA